MIANVIKNLPEVGYPLVREAESLDRRQADLNRLQESLNADLAQFKNDLLAHYNPEELVNGGVFGFNNAIAEAIWKKEKGVYSKR